MARHLPPILNVLLLVFAWPAALEYSGPGQQRLQIGSRADQVNAFIFQHFGYRADQRIRVARTQGQKHLGQAPVRPYGREYLLVLDLPSHDGGAHAFTLEKVDELAQFAQGQPVN